MDSSSGAGSKRKNEEPQNDAKKAKMDAIKEDTAGKTVFVEIETFSSADCPNQITQVGLFEFWRVKQLSIVLFLAGSSSRRTWCYHHQVPQRRSWQVSSPVCFFF